MKTQLYLLAIVCLLAITATSNAQNTATYFVRIASQTEQTMVPIVVVK